jgi:hypothetical protein
LPRSTRIHTITRHVVVINRPAHLQITPRPSTVVAGSAPRFQVDLTDETGAVIADAPVKFLVIYDWPDTKDWDKKNYDRASRANLTKPGHRRFVASFANLADTLDVEVIPRARP